jgi:GNAT superfamily N-acetyltransferase
MIRIHIADLHQPEDANALLDLLNQYATDPMGGGQSLPEYTRENLVSNLSHRQDCIVILAYHEKRAVGLCNCFEGFSTFACRPLLNIHDVFVTQHYQGQGIARQMMQKVEQLAMERGCCKLTLEVLANNAPAKKAYTDLGYQPYELDKQFGQAEFWQKKLPCKH